MSDDLMPQLRRAGAVLDRWRDEQIGAIPADGDDALVVRLTPMGEPASPRRRLILGAAAAVLLVAVAAIAVVNLSEPPSSPVASSGPIAAMLPPNDWIEGAEWNFGREHTMPHVGPSSETLLVPTSGEDRYARSVRAMSIDHAPAEDQATFVEYSETMHGYFPNLGPQWTALVAVETADPSTYVQLVTGTAMTREELFALAELIDSSMPVWEQDLGPDWEVLTTHNDALTGAVQREVSYQRDNVEVWVQTTTGGGPGAFLYLAQPFLATETTVRGRLAYAIDGSPGAATITWEEAPGVVVQLAYQGSGDDQVVDEAIAFAEQLVPADAARWAEINQEPHSSNGDHSVDTTTTVAIYVDGDPSTDPGARGPVILGTATSGQVFEAWKLDLDRLCWTVGNGPAECTPALGDAATPPNEIFIGIGDNSMLAIGFLPPGAATAELVTDDGVAYTTATDDFWATSVPGDYAIRSVIYRDAQGNEVLRSDIYRAENHLRPDGVKGFGPPGV